MLFSWEIVLASEYKNARVSSIELCKMTDKSFLAVICDNASYMRPDFTGARERSGEDIYPAFPEDSKDIDCLWDQVTMAAIGARLFVVEGSRSAWPLMTEIVRSASSGNTCSRVTGCQYFG